MLISTGPSGSKLLARTAASDPCWKRRLRPGWSALRTRRTRSPGVPRWPNTSERAVSRRRTSSCGTQRRRSQPAASRTTWTRWTANRRRDRPPVPGGAGAGGRARASEAPRGLDGAAARADPGAAGRSAPARGVRADRDAFPAAPRRGAASGLPGRRRASARGRAARRAPRREHVPTSSALAGPVHGFPRVPGGDPVAVGEETLGGGALGGRERGATRGVHAECLQHGLLHVGGGRRSAQLTGDRGDPDAAALRSLPARIAGRARPAVSYTHLT